MIRFTLNGQAVETDIYTDTPLLWVVRDYFKLKGVKVMSWHPQFRWWGNVPYESPVCPPLH